MGHECKAIFRSHSIRIGLLDQQNNRWESGQGLGTSTTDAIAMFFICTGGASHLQLYKDSGGQEARRERIRVKVSCRPYSAAGDRRCYE